MRNRLKQLHQYLIIRKSGLFDAHYYLKQNPDVRRADVNPLLHFVRCGWQEGRNPSANFDTIFYLQANPDVAAAGANPLVHYILCGRKEGRKTTKNLVESAKISKHAVDKNKKQKAVYRNTGLISKFLFSLKTYGIKHTIKKVRRKLGENNRLQHSKALHVPKLASSITQSEQICTIPASVSVVIPTKNAGNSFNNLLVQIKNQRGIESIEIVIVDSGSTDRTLEFAQLHHAKIHTIRPEEFTHSYSRNVGGRNATGEFLVFTTQDIIPPNDIWLYTIIRFFKLHKVAALSCSEFPRFDSDLYYRMLAQNHYKFLGAFETDVFMQTPESKDPIELRRNANLSDVCCLIKKEMFDKYEYRQNYAEDLDLGLRLIADGHKLAFLGSVQIIHSHNRPPFYYMRRAFVETTTLKAMVGDYVEIQTSFADLLLDILYTNAALDEIAKRLTNFPLPATPASIISFIREYFLAVRSKKESIHADFSTSIEDEGFKSFMTHYLEQYASPFLTANSWNNLYQGILINGILDCMAILDSYTNTTYEVIDACILKEIIQSLQKWFGMLCGINLANCYIFKKFDSRDALFEILNKGV